MDSNATLSLFEKLCKIWWFPPFPAQPWPSWSPTDDDSILWFNLRFLFPLAYAEGDHNAAVDTGNQGEDGDKRPQMRKSTSDGEEVGSNPDAEADKHKYREDGEERGGDTTTAAHACKVDTKTCTEVDWVQKEQGTS